MTPKSIYIDQIADVQKQKLRIELKTDLIGSVLVKFDNYYISYIDGIAEKVKSPPDFKYDHEIIMKQIKTKIDGVYRIEL